MHAERSDSRSADPLSIVEQAVIMMLLDHKQCVWSRADLQREIQGIEGNQLDAQDAISNLHGVGLLAVSGELVTATRAARRMDELEL